MAEIRSCPVAAALETNQLNLAREMRRLKRNLAICQACETANGNCRVSTPLRIQIRKALADLLKEMALDDE